MRNRQAFSPFQKDDIRFGERLCQLQGGCPASMDDLICLSVIYRCAAGPGLLEAVAVRAGSIWGKAVSMVFDDRGFQPLALQNGKKGFDQCGFSGVFIAADGEKK